MKKSLLSVLFFIPLFSLSQLTPKTLTSAYGNFGFYEFKPPGYNPDSSYRYPLIIFLHGVGERGNGTTELPMALLASFPKLLVAKATMQFEFNGRKHAFLVLLPQMSKKYTNWQDFYVDEMIRYAKENLNVNEDKIFLTGWSLGGGGVWKYPTSSPERASLLAGIIPVAPAPDYTDLCNLSRGNVAVWAHHARDDASVPIHFTLDAIQGIKACSPTIPPITSIYASGGHPFVANKAYDTLNSVQYPNIYQWMIGTTRSNNPTNNKSPVADAGKDTSIILPSVHTVLNGLASFDPNDIIVKYTWQLVNGRGSPNLVIERPHFPLTRVSGLEPGNYTFRLSVTDQFGVLRHDDINVAVNFPAKGENAAPLVDAGAVLKINADDYQVSCKAQDFDGKIMKYAWRQVGGPVKLQINNYGPVADVSGMKVPGNYHIEFSASDNGQPSKTGKDTLIIKRKPVRPFNIFYWSYNSGHDKFSAPNINTREQHRAQYGGAYRLFYSLFAACLLMTFSLIYLKSACSYLSRAARFQPA